MEPILCPWEPATFFFISSNVPLLINYSHFIAIFSALTISLLVIFRDPRNHLSQLFLLFSTLFSVWALLNIHLWATNDPASVMFAWSLQVLIEPLTYAIAFFLFYIFLHQKFPAFYLQVIIATALLPLIIFLPTELNLEAVQLSTCESIEGPIAIYYSYFLNLLFIIMIVAVGVRNLPYLEPQKRSTAIYFLIGLVTFLLSFTSGNIISSFTDDWTISQYGLFGMPVFASLIAYSMVRFNAFRIQIAGAQVLVSILWILVCSLLFVDEELFTVIVIATLIFASVAGFLLIKSVRQEFLQRLEIEKLATSLEKANKRLKVLDQLKSEFVSIASHQLRSPLTSVRGYASMLLEGSYGKLNDKTKDAVERIAESSRMMALSVEDYLNVSRIQAGNMKYELADFNLADTASHIVDDVRRDAIKRGLVLSFKTDMVKTGIVHADKGKTMQILHNLINNSIKYTPKGSITVFAHDSGKKIMIDVIDTGIGMSKETIESIFGKFERAKNANEVNVTGTGLGLYVAQKMAQEMGGEIEAFSDGEGKGSTFRLILPLHF